MDGANSPIFERNYGSITQQEQHILLQSRVAIVGCGGLGGYVAEELCRVGIGSLVLYDPDVFSISNCNRQINSLISTLDQKKVEVTAKRLVDIGTGCKVVAQANAFRQPETFSTNPPDVVVDCLDSIKDRFYLAEKCSAESIPMTHGAVNGWYGRVGVQSGQDNLIEQMYPQFDKKKHLSETPPSVLSFTVAVIASLQAAETVKILLDKKSSLENGWMDVDLKNMTFETIDLQ